MQHQPNHRWCCVTGNAGRKFLRDEGRFWHPPPRPQPNGWATNPPIHTWKIPSSKGEHVRTSGSTNQHTHSAFMAAPPPFLLSIPQTALCPHTRRRCCGRHLFASAIAHPAPTAPAAPAAPFPLKRREPPLRYDTSHALRRGVQHCVRFGSLKLPHGIHLSVGLPPSVPLELCSVPCLFPRAHTGVL